MCLVAPPSGFPYFISKHPYVQYRGTFRRGALGATGDYFRLPNSREIDSDMCCKHPITDDVHTARSGGAAGKWTAEEHGRALSLKPTIAVLPLIRLESHVDRWRLLATRAWSKRSFWHRQGNLFGLGPDVLKWTGNGFAYPGVHDEENDAFLVFRIRIQSLYRVRRSDWHVDQPTVTGSLLRQGRTVFTCSTVPSRTERRRLGELYRKRLLHANGRLTEPCPQFPPRTPLRGIVRWCQYGASRC
jgi:hypothetical protein